MSNNCDQQILATWFARLAPHFGTLESSSLPANPAADATAARSEIAAPRAGATERPPAESLLLSVARRAMACEFEVLLNQHQYRQGAERAAECLDLIELLEAKLSVYKPHSDLSQLNRFGGTRPVALAADTRQLLQLAQDIHAVTHGAFDITSGSLSDVWGFSRRTGEMPSAEDIAAALEVVGSQFLELDPDASQARLQRTGVKANPGGIGKGYALDRAAQYLSTAGIGDFMLHGGLSSVIASGHRQHPQTGGGWLVSLRHPWRLSEVLGTIRLRDQALGTSGSGKQFFHFGGQRYSHIIDPRSGWPAQQIMSATVICPSGAVADALATAFFVMGGEQTKQFCQRFPAIGAILVGADSGSPRPRIETFNLSEGQWTPIAKPQ